MTNKTKNVLHACLYEALKLGKDAVRDLEILECFVLKLQEAIHLNVPEVDKKEVSAFLEGVKTSLKKRRQKPQTRDFVTQLIMVMKVIQDWLSFEFAIHSTIMYSVREKPLESEFMKLYNKASSHERCLVRDRNSLSLIFLDNNLDQMYLIHNVFIGIITGLDQKAREDFMSWVVTHRTEKESYLILDILDTASISLETKGDMHDIEGFNPADYPGLKVPVKTSSDYIDFFKDYYVEPKSNSYQGLQGVLVWEDTNVFLELIFVLASSRDRNDYGAAAHKNHKAAEAKKASMKDEEDEKPIFHLKKSELAELNMANFMDYTHEKADRLHLYHEDIYYTTTHYSKFFSR